MRVRETEVENLLLAYGAKEISWEAEDIRRGEGARCCKFKLVIGSSEFQGWVRWQFVEHHALLMQMAFEIQSLSIEEWEFWGAVAAFGTLRGIEHFQYLSEIGTIIWIRTEDASIGPLHKVLYRLFSHAKEDIVHFAALSAYSDGDSGRKLRELEDLTHRLLSPAEGSC